MSHVETPWVVGSRPVRNPVPDLNALKKVVPQALTRFARGHVHWLADPQGRLFLFKMLPRGSVGAEIGVWKGDFSKLLLASRSAHRISPNRPVGSRDGRELLGGAV